MSQLISSVTIGNMCPFIKGHRYALEVYSPGPTEKVHAMFRGWDSQIDKMHFRADNIEGGPPFEYIIYADDIVKATDLSLPRLQTPSAQEATDEPATEEADPSGLKASDPGSKLDSGKIYADSILGGFPRALWGVAEVGTFGANKYTMDGWQSVEDGVRRYREAAARHRLKRQMGEAIDPESGSPHEYHEAWNVLAALELTLREE